LTALPTSLESYGLSAGGRAEVNLEVVLGNVQDRDWLWHPSLRQKMLNSELVGVSADLFLEYAPWQLQ
jgi:hypothetical protein